MIFSNNACMNILHITKVIIIILQGRNDWFGGFRNLLRRYLRTFEGMEYSFEGSATTKIWILTGSRTFLEWNHWIITNLNAYTRTGSFYCWAIFRHRENTPRLASRARMGGFEIASNPMRVPIHERVHVDAFVWFSNLEAISNRAERNVVSAVTGTHFRRPSCFINVHLRNLIM
jgi:hypothetical protein